MNPWNDLTSEELTEMVESCRDWFTFIDPDIGRQLDWEWKKGDWRWYGGNQITGEHYIDVVVDPNGVREIPLPLAHQWLPLLPPNYVIKSGGIFDITIGKTYGYIVAHENIHYAGCLAFRKVIEGDM